MWMDENEGLNEGSLGRNKVRWHWHWHSRPFHVLECLERSGWSRVAKGKSRAPIVATQPGNAHRRQSHRHPTLVSSAQQLFTSDVCMNHTLPTVTPMNTRHSTVSSTPNDCLRGHVAGSSCMRKWVELQAFQVGPKRAELERTVL